MGIYMKENSIIIISMAKVNINGKMEIGI
jgi:predicted transcriptional regulator